VPYFGELGCDGFIRYFNANAAKGVNVQPRPITAVEAAEEKAFIVGRLRDLSDDIAPEAIKYLGMLDRVINASIMASPSATPSQAPQKEF
jgi:hypothetical protein